MRFFFLSIIVFCCGFQSTAAQEEYQRAALDLHNEFRSKHHVDPLSNSDDLNSRAVKCAQYYADMGKIDHSCSDKNGAGENLWEEKEGSPTEVDAAKTAVNSWYCEEPKHDYNKDWQPDSGHFSQIVWKNTKELGFGNGRHGNMTVACALYSPPGNVVGEFKDNVFPP